MKLHSSSERINMIALGQHMVSVLKRARMCLHQHHQAGYELNWGVACPICSPEIMPDIFTEIDESVKDWEEFVSKL